MEIPLLLVVLSEVLLVLSFRLQSIKVGGSLVCDGKAYNGVKVKLWNIDPGSDPDDLIDDDFTSSEGIFIVEGNITQSTTINPVIKIYHDCFDSHRLGLRVTPIKISRFHVTFDGERLRPYYFGLMNIDNLFDNEERVFITDENRADYFQTPKK